MGFGKSFKEILKIKDDIMTAYCISICIKYRAHKPTSGMGRYAAGQKRCQLCAIFIDWGGLNCPCCKRRLRVVPRSKKGKEMYQRRRS